MTIEEKSYLRINDDIVRHLENISDPKKKFIRVQILIVIFV